MASDLAEQLADAAEAGDLEGVRALVEQHPQLLSQALFYGDTALHLACHQKHVTVVEYLVSKGADVNARGDLQTTPLHCAVDEGDERSTPVVRILLTARADPNALDALGRTPLDVAVGEAHDGLDASIRLLLESGAEWSPTAALFRRTPEQFIDSLDQWADRLGSDGVRKLASLVEQLTRPQNPMDLVDELISAGVFQSGAEKIIKSMADDHPFPEDPGTRLREHGRLMRQWIEGRSHHEGRGD